MTSSSAWTWAGGCHERRSELEAQSQSNYMMSETPKSMSGPYRSAKAQTQTQTHPCHMVPVFISKQQNAFAYNLSMQGVGVVATAGPRLEPGSDRSQRGLARGKGNFCCWVAQLGWSLLSKTSRLW